MTSKMIWKGARRLRADHNLVIMTTDTSTDWANVPFYLDEVNHSPTGFEWGYAGSGPHQLGYAILRTYFEILKKYVPQDAKRLALHFYGKFTGDIVYSKFGRGDEWELNSDEVDAWIEGQGVVASSLLKEEEGWV